MRVRSEERRQAIIDVATELFREVGFERTSMAMISRRLGGSKGTLYGYFQSKEELFETAMKAASEGPGDQIMDLLDPNSDDLSALLKHFAKASLAFILGSDVLAITRTAIAEGSGSTLGPHLFKQGPGRALDKMETFFADIIRRGKLRQMSPASASRHFKGLIEAGFHEEALYGAPTQARRTVDEAVDAFLRAYEAQPGARQVQTTSLPIPKPRGALTRSARSKAR